MSKTLPPTVPAQPAARGESTRTTLEEFCIRLSQSVSRPELIGAFESRERGAGRLTDADSAFRGRFDAFLRMPV